MAESGTPIGLFGEFALLYQYFEAEVGIPGEAGQRGSIPFGRPGIGATRRGAKPYDFQ